MKISERDELAVVTSFFTPAPHTRRARNFEIFQQQFAQSLYVAELAYDQQPWLTSPGPKTFHFRGTGRHVLWQKERLINLVISSLPAHITHVAWVDADVLFADAQWPARALEKLREFAVIQLFETIVHLDPQGRPLRQDESLAASFARIGADAFTHRIGTPGFAWAARRDLLKALPLLDCLVVGGADAYMAGGFTGTKPPYFLTEFPPKLIRTVDAWSARARSVTGGRLGWIPGSIGHLYHGNLKSREYLQRYEILRKSAFDPVTDLAIDSGGLYGWASPKPKLHSAVADYFGRRAVAENL